MTARRQPAQEWKVYVVIDATGVHRVPKCAKRGYWYRSLRDFEMSRRLANPSVLVCKHVERKHLQLVLVRQLWSGTAEQEVLPHKFASVDAAVAGAQLLDVLSTSEEG